jgi:hypothetical protein
LGSYSKFGAVTNCSLQLSPNANKGDSWGEAVFRETMLDTLHQYAIRVQKLKVFD